MKSSAFFSSFGTLQWALALSVALHGALLTVRFVHPEAFQRIFQDTPLEVILVNARSDERPDQAQAIAQHALAGGGEAEQGRASSPLPYSALTKVGDDYEEAQRQIQALQQEQMRLMAELSKQITALPPTELKNVVSGRAVEEQEEKRRQLLKLLAEIEKRINDQNARPKKRYVSPATREEVYAIYYDAMRRKVEDKGTANFPERDGQKIYGELTMIVTVNHDGQVLETEVIQGSGSALLDHRAEAIARAAGPFEPFSQAMLRQADQIAVVSRFKFTRDQTLETQVQ